MEEEQEGFEHMHKEEDRTNREREGDKGEKKVGIHEKMEVASYLLGN